MELNAFNQGLLAFLEASPTPYHAVSVMRELLDKAGFERLDETHAWNLESGKGYYVVRNDSALVAFRTGRNDPAETGWRMMGAHTDSPCLRVKPQPEIREHGCFQLGVEVYGGALLNPWFDRDLSIAGRVTVEDRDGQRRDTLVDFRKPIATIPSLAIHLDREANSGRSINAQTHLPPLVMLTGGKPEKSFRELLEQQLQAEQPDLSVRQVLDYELSLYDTQAPAITGLHDEFIASARLDNLLSCYLGLQALLEADGEQPSVAVFNDHEEVGSMTAEGAQGPFLETVLGRWVTGEDYHRAMAASMMMSVDNAHAIHPNYADRHDSRHGPLLNEGPVIKINNNQRYATSSRTSALYRHLSDQLGLSCQSFVVRSDMACGSTIGPLTAGNLGVKTLDIGVPQLAMHSIRELAGTQDAHNLYQVLKAYFGLDGLW
ncbi:aspartyl aminopeptidase [Halospina denitrificans]|uniref:M18 family aminopeptidase n=1 Tax=Halospina denitrificans TaxID=332522 RepID=A0A4R7JXX5_9GAMM|nr:M18 family aminopeptidase [Halospina denitrificans]TDT43015.1 aspartyl aminopeptidase [Halospina denitrificans]